MCKKKAKICVVVYHPQSFAHLFFFRHWCWVRSAREYKERKITGSHYARHVGSFMSPPSSLSTIRPSLLPLFLFSNPFQSLSLSLSFYPCFLRRDWLSPSTLAAWRAPSVAGRRYYLFLKLTPWPSRTWLENPHSSLLGTAASAARLLIDAIPSPPILHIPASLRLFFRISLLSLSISAVAIFFASTKNCNKSIHFAL